MDKRLYELALLAAKRETPAEFSNENIEDALRGELQKMAGSINEFMRNRYDIYDIIIQTADEILPKKALDTLGAFAEIKTVKQGQKAMFTVKKGRMRAKKFLTQVGLSGVYETFRLDKDTFEVGAHAVGGGATIDFERYLDGAEDMAELMDIIVEGLTDAVFLEVQKALRASLSVADRPSVNTVSQNGFDSDKMFKLVGIARAYGQGAVIFAPPEFIAEMGADAIVPIPASGNYGGVYHPQDIDAIHNTGYVNMFRGTPIVQIPQSFVDEKNDKTWIDPRLAYVIPTGGEKIVKVVLEGQTQVKDHENKDNSMEIYAWKKMGCAILTYHNWCVYENQAIPQTIYNPYGM
jgi:hypothetical protein